MWQLVTSVPKNEQDITVWFESLSSNVKVEKAIDQFTATDLNADDGMKTLLNKLHNVFQSEALMKLLMFPPCS